MDFRMIAAAAVALSVAVTGAALAGPGKPLNAGKDGFKSNAGGGNGTEDYLVGSTTTEITSETSYTYDQATGEPVVETTTTTAKTETDRELIGGPVAIGNSGNTKVTYSVTYEVVTTTDTTTTTSYETVEVTEVYKTPVSTDDFEDRDPGRSVAVNKAPEGQAEDVVTYGDPVLEISALAVIDSYDVVDVDTDAENSVTHEDHDQTCNPGNSMCDGDGLLP